MSYAIRLFLVIVACAAATPAGGQTVAVADTASIGTLLAGLRSQGNSAAVTARLAQDFGPRPQAELDALADSLVGIAIAYRRGDPLSVLGAARAATLAIGLAARPGRAAERWEQLQALGVGHPPVPSPGSFDRLVQVVESPAEIGIKAAALWMLTQLSEPGRAAAYLGEVATWNSFLAQTALRYLVTDMGDAGLPILRRLYETGAVVEPTARENIVGIAATYGWRQ